MSGLSTPGVPTGPTVYTPQSAQAHECIVAGSGPAARSGGPAGRRGRRADGRPRAVVTADAPPPEAGAEPSKRPSNEDLNNLSRWLYPLIRYQLKGELREDRERAGLLTDHYRRW